MKSVCFPSAQLSYGGRICSCSLERNERRFKRRESYSSSLEVFKLLPQLLFRFSESMTPIFERGDLLFLAMPSTPLRAGDIPVFQIKGQSIPIVHRLLEIHKEYCFAFALLKD